MALPKLPCEYKELQRRRWKDCFGNLSEEEQLKLIKVIQRITEICEV